MSETLTLDTPITRSSIGGFTISRIILTWEPPRLVQVELVGDDGVERRAFAWSDTAEEATATQMITGLNKANLSLKSLHRRIYERLVSDGYLAGTIAGSPD